MGWCGLDYSGSGYGPIEGCCEHDNEPSRLILNRNTVRGVGVFRSSRPARGPPNGYRGLFPQW
jgi:hypothetical protein